MECIMHVLYTSTSQQNEGKAGPAGVAYSISRDSAYRTIGVQGQVELSQRMKLLTQHSTA